MTSRPANWTRDELLAAFSLYVRTPFGRLHSRNPEIAALATRIGRSPNAVAMKLVNFASLDPTERARNVRGLSNASQSDRDLLAEFSRNPEAIAIECGAVWNRLYGEGEIPHRDDAEGISEPVPRAGLTEVERLAKARIVQAFFRGAVLSSYAFRCAFCELSIPDLLTASHIIPWSHSVQHRADPRNGLSLCANHDRAFDRGLITVDESLCIVVSPYVSRNDSTPMYRATFHDISGRKVTMPSRFSPASEAIEYHRTNIYRAAQMEVDSYAHNKSNASRG